MTTIEKEITDIGDGLADASNSDDQYRALVASILLVARTINDLKVEVEETNKHLSTIRLTLRSQSIM
jgi:hypothetical protein